MQSLNLRPLVTLAMVATMLCAPDLRAGEGHNHDHDAAPAAAGPALPRFAATSELFELVGVINGKQLMLYLDHADDNRPVRDAKLELELGGTKVPVESHAEGEFEAVLAEELSPGVIPVTATVVTGQETDLLAGELDLHEEEHVEEAHVHSLKEYVGWIAGALVALIALIGVGRKLLARRTVRTKGAA